MSGIDKVVILARGLGTRMRKAQEGALLDDRQAAIADTGVKALIPIKRPFLDYVLSALADAGYRRVCLVIGPEHQAVREYYTGAVQPRRLTIEFALQDRPLGTADAVAAAEEFAGRDEFLAINSDNYYPIEALCALREISGQGLAAFERQSMIAASNIPPERIAKFALVRDDGRGFLGRIIEKPDPRTIAAMARGAYVSMNCWRFEASIFAACRAIPPSPRGELELTDAVQYSIDSLGGKFRVLAFQAPVLDLSSRTDIAGVSAELAPLEVDL